MTGTREYFEQSDTAEIDPGKTNAFVRHTEQFMQQLEQRGWLFVKAVVHLDEHTPHVVAYGIPFDPTGKLNASHHLNGRAKLSALQDEYAGVMAPLGLARGVRGSQANHQEVSQYYARIDQLV